MIGREWNKDDFTNTIIDMIHENDTVQDNFSILIRNPKKIYLKVSINPN